MSLISYTHTRRGGIIKDESLVFGRKLTADHTKDASTAKQTVFAMMHNDGDVILRFVVFEYYVLESSVVGIQ